MNPCRCSDFPYGVPCIYFTSRSGTLPRLFRVLAVEITEAWPSVKSLFMSRRILIADDHAIVRRMLKVLVETHEGWQVCAEAENGQEAVLKVEEHKPDLVIMDMAMPVRDGISASREISAKIPGIPIVMHTLHYSTELELEAKKAGVCVVVPKAEAGDELLKAMERVLTKAGKASGGEAALQQTSSSAAAADIVPVTASGKGNDSTAGNDEGDENARNLEQQSVQESLVAPIPQTKN